MKSSSWQLLCKIASKAFTSGAYIGYAYCFVKCTSDYVGDIVICQGPSMEPTLQSYDVILTEHISILQNKIDRGDIIVSRSPNNPKEFICKRVKAIAGDKVRRGLAVQVVPSGHVWLEGDNRYNSTDSRNYGPVPIGLLKSRAVCRVYPFENIKMFKGS